MNRTKISRNESPETLSNVKKIAERSSSEIQQATEECNQKLREQKRQKPKIIENIIVDPKCQVPVLPPAPKQMRLGICICI